MSETESDARRRDRLAIAIPAAIAVVLCFIDITGRNLGFDEAATVTIAAQHGSSLGTAIAHDGGNMSGYYLLVHVLIGAFGNGLFVTRLPSALASVATVALVATIALRLFDRRAAFACGLLTAVSLPLVFWAQNARGYALMVAFVCGAFLVFVALARSGPAAPERPVRLWVAYVILMALATYSSFVAVLVIPVQALALLPAGRRDRLRPFALAVVSVAVLCTPLIVLAVHRGSSQLFWVTRPTHMLEVQVLQSLTSAGLQPSFHRTATTTSLLILTILVLIGVTAGFVRSWRVGTASWGEGLAIAWLVVPVAIAFVYSFIGQPVFVPRNLLMAVPPVGLLLGAALTRPRVSGRLAVIAPLLLGVIVLGRALQIVPAYATSPEPWRQATTYVLDRAQPGDCIAFYPLDARMPFQYYLGDGATADARAPRSILPVLRWGRAHPYVEAYVTLTPAQIAARAVGCRRMWFVTSHEGQKNGPARSLANRAEFMELRRRLERQFGRAPVEQLGYASAIHVQLLPGRS